MKSVRLLAVLSFVLCCAGCDVLTNAQLPVIHDDRIVGEWKPVPKAGEEHQSERLIVKRAGEDYLSGDADDFARNKASRFTLSKVGRLVLVQSQEGVGGPCEPFGKKSEMCRTLYGAIEIGPDQVVIHPFDSSRLLQDSLGGALKIPHQIRRSGSSNGKGDNAVFFDTDAKQLQSFVESYLPAHPMVFARSLAKTYHRIPLSKQ